MTDSETVSIPRAFALLDNEFYHDVFLEGTDDIQIPATRVALSVRSEYFKKLFGTGFKESTNKVVHIGFDSDILRAAVEFIHTDKASILDQLCKETAQTELTQDSIQKFQTLLKLTEAANYLVLPELSDEIQPFLSSYVCAFPALAFATVVASTEGGPVISKDLMNVAWSICNEQSSPWNEVLIGDVNPLVLEKILQDENLKITDSALFDLLNSWAVKPTDAGETRRDQRLSIAKGLVEKYVELQWIDPDKLSDVVASSGLVAIEQLANAYKYQAQQAKHVHNISFCKAHTQSPTHQWSWNNTKSNIVVHRGPYWVSDRLRCAPLIRGKKYCLICKTEGTYVWLGLTKNGTKIWSDSFYGDVQDCWGIYGLDGMAYYSKAGRKALGRHGSFAEGALVTMVLDLSPGEPNNGSLSISVNGQASHLAISDLLCEQGTGFVPVVSCGTGSSATVLSLNEV